VAPHISPDGRYVVFESGSTNFVSGTSGNQIYYKDLTLGTLLLASSTDGTGANQANSGDASNPFVSADGGYVFFLATANNLVSGSTGPQIFRKHLEGGSLTLVTSLDGTAATRANSNWIPSFFVEPSGRYIAFTSDGTNLVSGTSGVQLFQKDMTSGSVTLVSSIDGSAAQQGDAGDCTSPVHLSSDGRYVAFGTSSTNLVSGATGAQIYRKDLSSGVIILLSSSDGSAPNRANQDGASNPFISDDGGIAFFESNANNLISGIAGTQVYRRQIGGALSRIEATATHQTAAQSISAGESSITPDVRYALFTADSSNLFKGGSRSQVFRKTLSTGQVVLVSSVDGTVSQQANQGGASSAKMTPDGRHVVFISDATNLVIGTFGPQIFRKDLDTNSIVLVSSSDGTPGNAANSSLGSPQSSADGRYVVFSSDSTNLMSGASGNQAYRKDLVSGTLQLASSLDGTAATQPNGICSAPVMTSDGRYIFFSVADPSWGSTFSFAQVFRKDMQTGDVLIVSSLDGTSANRANGDGALDPQISPDGRYVSFRSASTNLVPGITVNVWGAFMKDMQTGEIVVTSSMDGDPANMADSECGAGPVSADGRYVLFSTGASNIMGGIGGWFRADLVNHTAELTDNNGQRNL